MKANVGKGVAGFTESQPGKSWSYSEWRRVQQGVAVKPQLIVAEDCLLLSSDSRCSGKTSNNLRLRKGSSGGGWIGWVWRVGWKRKVGEGWVEFWISKGK